MDWAAWGPTIVSIITCIFFAGVLWSTQSNHGKRLDNHDTQFEEHTRDITKNALDIRELKAWKEGYAAARAMYDRTLPHGANGD
jgi:hypothetical protein